MNYRQIGPHSTTELKIGIRDHSGINSASKFFWYTIILTLPINIFTQFHNHVDTSCSIARWFSAFAHVLAHINEDCDKMILIKAHLHCLYNYSAQNSKYEFTCASRFCLSTTAVIMNLFQIISRYHYWRIRMSCAILKNLNTWNISNTEKGGGSFHDSCYVWLTKKLPFKYGQL